MNTNATPANVGSNDGLGPAPERTAFEAWQSDDGRWPKAVERDGEGYKLAASHAAWTAWRAAWVRAEKLQRERLAKLCETMGPVLCESYGDGAECIATADACAEAIRKA